MRFYGKVVGPGGLEPLTSSVSRKRSNQLSYGPTKAGLIHFTAEGGVGENRAFYIASPSPGVGVRASKPHH